MKKERQAEEKSHREKSPASNATAHIKRQRQRRQSEAQKVGLQMDNLPADETLQKAENIRNRLIARRDPLQLKEYFFWMMWQMYHLGQAKRCVEIATEDIELSPEFRVDKAAAIMPMVTTAFIPLGKSVST